MCTSRAGPRDLVLVPRQRELIASHTPADLDRVFFTNGGADANEHAVRMARLHTR